MKTIRIFVSGVGVCAALGSVEAGDFKNLDFSQPDLTGLQDHATYSAGDVYYGDPGQVVPGWTISLDQQPINQIWVTEGGLMPPVTLQIDRPPQVNKIRYDGSLGPGSPQSISIEQTAIVPEWALTLEFVWSGDKGLPSPLHVDGQRQPIFLVSGFDCRADISQWAGREVTLSFEFPRGSGGAISGIQFTVPEPSTWALIGVGGVGLGWLVLRGRKRG